ncbi:precorrin-2 dehydrogenase/sirohydrochlorin ferrochelatase family protein [Halomarina pelagica]|uniref:precorrin-2 dehydrogenase/sirohydrochlorin ferrochelatase family protein n=1 Tax=Halomarina pelagica TaxID=2961599 RepID=UPI0020C3C115|nr:bifunctional precorrin-2 dehydrogenase/sirohydrochlorin ferrochelatase [Halomarina sp. BND7]
MIPLLHDFTGRRVLVFGGGRVGARRARTFAREAEVVVVSPAFVGDGDGEREGDEPGDERGYGDATLVRAAPAPDDVPAWFDRVAPALVVAATDDPSLNDAIAAEARARGVLVNRADRAGGRDLGGVAIPATVRDDPVVVAVSTGGRSPALSRVLRERIEREIDGAGDLARVTGDLRERLRDDHPPDERRAAVRAVVRSDRVWKTLGGGADKTETIVDEIVSAELGEST